jgi:peptide/nickel transport system substrate-binding protein/oligopeptide transport system substrate-binding protein
VKRLLLILFVSLFGVSGVLAQNTLRLASGEDWENLDPAFAGGVQTGAMVAKLFDGLMRYDYETTDVVPNLAANVDVNEDSTVFTFTLHDGVKFHDGSTLTADDVKYSFERVVNPETGGSLGWVFVDAMISGAAAFDAGEADEISGIVVKDPLTIEITLDEPYSLLLYHLAMPAAHVVSEAVASELGPDFSTNPVGTGPFKLGERVRDSSLNLVANKDYFAGAPKIDGVEYRIITESLIRWEEFLAGNLHVSGIPDAIFADVVNDPQYADLILKQAELATFYWAMNQRFEPFQDVRVRRAMAMAIDRQAIIDGPYNGKDILANGPIPPGLAGYVEREGIGYDPEGAKALLAEAGYADGFDLEIWSTRAETTVAVSELIQFFLSEVGVRAQINQVDFGTLIDGAINGRAPAFYLSWYADYADAYNFMHPLYVASGAQRYAYSNPEVAALISEAASTASLEDRLPLYEQAEELIVEDIPVVYIRHPVSYSVQQPDVTGLLAHPIFNADKFVLVDLGN